MDCSFVGASYTMVDVINCSIINMGVPFDFLVIGIFAAFLLFAAIARLDFDFSLAAAVTLTWALMVLSGPMGGSLILQYLWGLLIIGVGLRLLMGAIAIFRQ